MNLLGISKGAPNVFEISLPKLLSEESFINHRRRVTNFVADFMCGMREPKPYQPIHSSVYKPISTNRREQFVVSSSLRSPSEESTETDLNGSEFGLSLEVFIEVMKSTLLECRL